MATSSPATLKQATSKTTPTAAKHQRATMFGAVPFELTATYNDLAIAVYRSSVCGVRRSPEIVLEKAAPMDIQCGDSRDNDRPAPEIWGPGAAGKGNPLNG